MTTIKDMIKQFEKETEITAFKEFITDDKSDIYFRKEFVDFLMAENIELQNQLENVSNGKGIKYGEIMEMKKK